MPSVKQNNWNLYMFKFRVRRVLAGKPCIGSCVVNVFSGSWGSLCASATPARDTDTAHKLYPCSPTISLSETSPLTGVSSVIRNIFKRVYVGYNPGQGWAFISLEPKTEALQNIVRSWTYLASKYLWIGFCVHLQYGTQYSILVTGGKTLLFCFKFNSNKNNNNNESNTRRKAVGPCRLQTLIRICLGLKWHYTEKA
jgi:hypothetical protein